MTEMQIEYWEIDRLLPYVRNPRQNDHVVEKVAQAIREFGFRVPVIARSSNEVIDGHLRLKAARHLGMTKVPVVCADDMTDAQVKAFRISVNRMAELADWDLDALRLEVQDLSAAEFDLELTGLEEGMLDGLLQALDPNDGLTDPDEVPPAPKEPTTRLGDLWILGNHRLLCGDSTSIDAVSRLMADEQTDMVFSDPPYNVAYEGKTKDKLTIKNDNMDSARFAAFLRDAFGAMAAAAKPGAAFYICHADSEVVNFRQALEDSGWLIKQTLVWVKNQFILGRQDHQWQHEPILYGWKDGGSHQWHGDRKQSTVIEGITGLAVEVTGGGAMLSFSDGKRTAILRVPSYEVVSAVPDELTTIWRVDKPTRNGDHPTMKPVALVERAITNSSRSGGVVLDLFGGSGSTLIACETTGRRGRLMELDPIYCDVIVRRWEKFTGGTAVLANEDRTFAEIAEAR